MHSNMEKTSTSDTCSDLKQNNALLVHQIITEAISQRQRNWPCCNLNVMYSSLDKKHFSLLKQTSMETFPKEVAEDLQVETNSTD